jgi:hypothetical protein
MLTDRLRRAIAHAGELPIDVQEDLAEQIEDLFARSNPPSEPPSIRELIGDDGSDAFFDAMMDALDRIGHSVPPTPLIKDM